MIQYEKKEVDMFEEKIDDVVPVDCLITDDTIENLKELTFSTIDDLEIISYIHWQCQKVLEFAKNKNESKEVARALNLETFDIVGTVVGNARTVDIDYLVQQMTATNYAFLVVHNHPSDLHFSRRDIKTFIDSVNITILIVIGNKGSIYIIEKTRQIQPNETLSIRKTLVDWKNGVITFDQVTTQIEEFGIVYREL